MSLLRVCVGRQKIRAVCNRDHCSGFALVDKRFGLFGIEITAQGLRWSTKDSGCLSPRGWCCRACCGAAVCRRLFLSLEGEEGGGGSPPLLPATRPVPATDPRQKIRAVCNRDHCSGFGWTTKLFVPCMKRLGAVQTWCLVFGVWCIMELDLARGCASALRTDPNLV